jgi:ribosome-associated translation inhibitor RaiA
MQIQVNSGSSVSVDDELISLATSIARRTLGRFEPRLTRLEIHVNDHNSHRGGAQDKSCQIEARPAGLDPVSATHNAGDVEAALRGAAQKLERLLDTLFGRRDNFRPQAGEPAVRP